MSESERLMIDEIESLRAKLQAAEALIHTAYTERQELISRAEAAEAQNRELEERLCTESRCTDQFIEENDALRSRAEAAEAAIREYAEITDGLRSRAEALDAYGAKLVKALEEMDQWAADHAEYVSPVTYEMAVSRAEAAEAESTLLKMRHINQALELDRLRTRIAELEAWLREYGDHRALCNREVTMIGEYAHVGCTCGFDRLLDGRGK